jgi:hypothetical protein
MANYVMTDILSPLLLPREIPHRAAEQTANNDDDGQRLHGFVLRGRPEFVKPRPPLPLPLPLAAAKTHEQRERVKREGENEGLSVS